MKKTVFVVLLVFAVSIGMQSQQPAKDLSWAFPVKNGDLPPEAAGNKTLLPAALHNARDPYARVANKQDLACKAIGFRNSTDYA